MARHSTGTLTGAGSTTLPLISLYSAAARGGKLREVGIFNTTTTGVALKLVRLTTQGTPGGDLTEAEWDQASLPDMTAFGTHTIAPSLGKDLGFRAHLGAAIGANVIWTMTGSGIIIPVGTANGVGVIVENGVGQICQAYLVWDE